jgi:superfamily I DNA/RNA helicase
VVRGRISDRQAVEIAKFCGVECPEARDSIGFLKGLDSPAAAPLREAFDAARAGDASIAVAEKIGEAIGFVDTDAAEEVAPIIAAIGDFESHDPEFALDDLLAELALGSGGRAPTAGSGITVATLHKTKGLQWPIVYMLGLEHGHLPDYRDEENPVREERRLCFVGVCRAEDELILTRIQNFGRHVRKPSRFINELGLQP